ncbi:MAG: Holliday junction resolvase RuvX [Planctomycetaceae bacterium]
MATANWTGDELPTDGRIVAVDFGTKRLGLAISTPEQNLSTPLEVITRYTAAVDARRLRDLQEDYLVAGYVVGLPLHMNGDESSSSHKAREFGRWLKETTGKPVGFWDERCSSAAADDWMLEADLTRQHRKQLRDKLAAHVILQSFLAAHRPARPPE